MLLVTQTVSVTLDVTVGEVTLLILFIIKLQLSWHDDDDNNDDVWWWWWWSS